jgi:maltooligosyltrehalose trehalohydrolase
MLFMGEEWGCKQPFLYFCDFGGELADAVREGRRAEFARFAAFADAAARSRIPDPLAQSTFKRSVLRWKDRDSAPGEGWMKHTRALLELRSREIVPRIARARRGRYRLLDAHAFEVRWPLGEAGELALLANLGAEPLAAPPPIEGAILWSSAAPGTPWSATWWLAA